MNQSISAEAARVLRAEAEEHLKKMLVYEWLSTEAFLCEQACAPIGIRFHGVSIDEESQEFLFLFEHKNSQFARGVSIESLMDFDPNTQAPGNSSEEEIERNLRKSAKRMRFLKLTETVSAPFKAVGRLLGRLDAFLDRHFPSEAKNRPG